MGVGRHANTGADIADAARRELQFSTAIPHRAGYWPVSWRGLVVGLPIRYEGRDHSGRALTWFTRSAAPERRRGPFPGGVDQDDISGSCPTDRDRRRSS
jgi:hypothetical protein